MAAFALPFLWGMAVLAALVGWGWAAARLAGAGEVDWGLRAGWGLGLVLALGGGLALVGLATRPVILVVVFAGLALFAFSLRGRPLARNPDRAGTWAGIWDWGGPYSRLELGLIAVVLALVALRYASVVSYQSLACTDDDIVYFTYVERLLQTGTLIEPFGFRRLATYGGHSVLQALVLAAVPETAAFLMDRGIAAVVAFGLVAGLFPGPGRERVLGLVVAVVVVVVLPMPLLNSSSHVTGLTMLLTLFRTLDRLSDAPASRRAEWWLAGVVAAGTASLKAHLVVAAAVTVAAWWAVAVWRRRDEIDGHAAVLGHMVLAGVVSVAPWMALLQLSSATVLYPLFPGNLTPGFAQIYSGGRSMTEHIPALLGFFVDPRISLMLVPLAFFFFGRGRIASLALYMGALAVLVGVGVTLTHDDVIQLHRLTAPVLNAAFIATMATLLRDQRRAMQALGRAVPLNVGDGLVVAALLLAPITLDRDVMRLATGLNLSPVPEARRADYARMQAAVPAGAAVLAVVDRPFLLDYRRNRIFNIDVPGAASPPPGMPYFEGPTAVKAYLAGLGIRHVAYRDFDIRGGCLYRRDLWRFQAAGDNLMWAEHARWYLDLMDSIDALAASERVLFDAAGLRVIEFE